MATVTCLVLSAYDDRVLLAVPLIPSVRFSAELLAHLWQRPATSLGASTVFWLCTTGVSMLCAGMGILFPQTLFEDVVAIQLSITAIELVCLRLIERLRRPSSAEDEEKALGTSGPGPEKGLRVARQESGHTGGCPEPSEELRGLPPTNERWVAGYVPADELDKKWQGFACLPGIHVVVKHLPPEAGVSFVAIRRTYLEELRRVGFPFTAVELCAVKETIHLAEKIMKPIQGEINVHGVATAKEHARCLFYDIAKQGIDEIPDFGLVRFYRSIAVKDAIIPFEAAILLRDIEVGTQRGQKLGGAKTFQMAAPEVRQRFCGHLLELCILLAGNGAEADQLLQKTESSMVLVTGYLRRFISSVGDWHMHWRDIGVLRCVLEASGGRRDPWQGIIWWQPDPIANLRAVGDIFGYDTSETASLAVFDDQAISDAVSRCDVGHELKSVDTLVAHIFSGYSFGHPRGLLCAPCQELTRREGDGSLAMAMASVARDVRVMAQYRLRACCWKSQLALEWACLAGDAAQSGLEVSRVLRQYAMLLTTSCANDGGVQARERIEQDQDACRRLFWERAKETAQHPPDDRVREMHAISLWRSVLVDAGGRKDEAQEEFDMSLSVNENLDILRSLFVKGMSLARFTEMAFHDFSSHGLPELLRSGLFPGGDEEADEVVLKILQSPRIGLGLGCAGIPTSVSDNLPCLTMDNVQRMM